MEYRVKFIKYIKWIILSLFILLGVWMGYDIYKNRGIKRTNSKDSYSRTLTLRENEILDALENDVEVDLYQLRDSLSFIDKRYDTSDFRFPSIIRILYSHYSKIPSDLKDEIKISITGMKFWMDQPGDDSICYWSENHQILFATGEYLFGNFYRDEYFTNMNITGREHSEMGKKRVLTWLEQRFLYGFTEWYSSTYYVEDITSLAVLIDFAPDEEVRIKASMIMDLLIYDLALQNYKGTFTANSGRMYESAKMSGRFGSMKESISQIWPEYNRFLKVDHLGGMEVNFRYIKNYTVPEVIRDIGMDQEREQIYKASTGINLTEFKIENLIGLKDNQIMMQFNVEAFTNPEIISNTIDYVDKTGMFTNEFLHDLKLMNIGALKTFNLLPVITKLIEPMYDGTAIQRANTYMYRTPYYAMSTAQAYHPESFGDQHNLFSLNINNDFNIFIQHPAASLKEGGALGLSPNYWVGNGYHPHTVQDRNINMTIFMLPQKTNVLGELTGVAREIQDYTHAFFPKQYMDQVEIESNYAFARIKDLYVALITKNNLSYKVIEHNSYDYKLQLEEEYDLIQQGREVYWITEVSTTDEYRDFEEFKSSIKTRDVVFINGVLTYSADRVLKLKFGGNFNIDGIVQDLEYKRFDNIYSQTDRKSPVIDIRFGGKSLTLDFYSNKRIVKH